jgi:protein-tyrosine phosphatase
MAAALFRARLMLNEEDWRLWRVDSAGTWATPGQPAVLEAQQVIKNRGMDLSSHRSRLVSADLLRRFHLILTMEAGHKEAIFLDFPEFRARVYLLSEMANQTVPVQDPIGGTLQDFERTADIIDTWLSAGIDRIKFLARPA